jgi:hypothetical protein
MFESENNVTPSAEKTPKSPKWLTRDEDKANKKPLHLTERDKEIFRHLARARLLNSDQIAALVQDVPSGSAPPRGGTYDPAEPVIKRLRRLFDHGYVDRLRHQEHIILAKGWGGKRPLVYALSQQGAGVLAEDSEDPAVDLKRWGKLNREIKWRQIEHSLLISHCYTMLHCALKKSSDFQLLQWIQGERAKDVFFTDPEGQWVPRPQHDQEVTRHVVYPDAFFGLAGPGDMPGSHRPGGAGRSAMWFMLECDRSTEESSGRFLQKLIDYWKYNRLGLHTRRWKDAAGRGVRRFVVLTVCKTPQRRTSLTKVAVDADDRHAGSAMYRFAHVGEFPLGQPEKFFRAVWWTPVDSEPRELFS